PSDGFPVWRRRGASCSSFRSSGEDPKASAEVVSDYSGPESQNATPGTRKAVGVSRWTRWRYPACPAGRINGSPYPGGGTPRGYAVLLVDRGHDARADRTAALSARA